MPNIGAYIRSASPRILRPEVKSARHSAKSSFLSTDTSHSGHFCPHIHCKGAIADNFELYKLKELLGNL